MGRKTGDDATGHDVVSIPQLIYSGIDPCELVQRWSISEELARRVVEGARIFGGPVSIISGHRSEAYQDVLRREGRPTADPGVSTHTECPATGVDLWPQMAITNHVKYELSTSMVIARLRWGGNSKPDKDGIPSDWNHFDLGPRVGRKVIDRHFPPIWWGSELRE